MSPDNRIAIALSGLKGSGKSYLARALGTALNWPVISTGDVVRRWAAAATGVADAEGVRLVADNARQTELGVMGNVLEAVWPNQAVPNRLIIDSIHESADVTYLRKTGCYVVVLTISASFKTRFRRMHDRHRSDDTSAAKQLRALDRWEYRLGLGKIQGDFNIAVKSAQLDKLLPRVLRQLRPLGIADA